MKKVLNVGGNNREIPIPSYYEGWEHHILDIDPIVNPDILCDAMLLKDMTKYKGQYDSVYCSHNLEHYYQHKVNDVIDGFHMVLKPEGFCYIAVPHMMNVLRKVVAYNMELTDGLYEVSGGPISAHDIMFGWGRQIKESGCDFFAHKCAFTPKSLQCILSNAGFFTYTMEIDFELRAVAYKQQPTQEMLDEIGQKWV